MDGSAVTRPPVDLQGVSGTAVLTKLRVVDTQNVQPQSPAADCIRSSRAGPPSVPLVERVGVVARTITWRSAAGLHGCEDTPAREDGRRWCGTAFGRLYDGHLRDPRLDIAACRTDDGDPVALAWVETPMAARYLALDQPGYTEVYEIAAGLPVRIATRSGVEVTGSRARFDLSEHDAAGRLLRRYHLDAAVAG
jgi:hypothetical protein